jgi:hypothetical protein
MTESTIYKYYKDLPSWAKGVAIIGGLAMGYALVTTIYNKVNDLNNKAKQEKEVNTADAELRKEQQAGRGQTLSNSSLEAMSSAIVEASNGCGSEEDIIVAQFDNLQNEADMLAFVKIFGLRDKLRCPFSDDAYGDKWCLLSCRTPVMSLSSMLYSELSQGWIDTLNKKLGQKGIKYRF